MPSLNIQANTGPARAKLARLLAAVQPRVILDVIGGNLQDWVEQSFKTRGRGAWPPLAETTLMLRRHGGDVPLQDIGRYKQSWVVESDGQTWVEIGSNVKTPDGAHSLAKIHEYGTGPYTIRARTARVLAARTREGGWLVFGKEVHHPGIPARPVLPTKAEAETMVVRTVEGMFRRITGGSAA